MLLFLPSQKPIIFYDDEITAVVIDGDEQEVYIPLRPLCDYFGVSWQGQNRRINEDEVLSDVIMSVNITLTQWVLLWREKSGMNYLGRYEESPKIGI